VTNRKKTLNDVGGNKNILRRNGLGRTASPTEVMGKTDPSSMTMEEGCEWRIKYRHQRWVVGSSRVSHQI
jgi:hypothetical protein